MAERRMFAKTIIDSDAFLDMPTSTQALYFHLAMRADDEGFLNNPKKVQRMVGASEDDLRLLLSKRFILAFESGVIVIKHWKIHNYIRADRIIPTVYKDERALLEVKENGSYTSCQSLDGQMSAKCLPSDGQMTAQDSIGKYREDKDRLGKERIGEMDAPKAQRTQFIPPTLDQVSAYCIERGNTIDPQHFIDHYSANGWKVGRNPMKDWKAAVRTWERNGYDRKQTGNKTADMLHESYSMMSKWAEDHEDDA